MSTGFFVRNPSYANSVSGSISKCNDSGLMITPSLSSFSLATVTSITLKSDVTSSISPWPVPASKNVKLSESSNHQCTDNNSFSPFSPKLPSKFRELVYSLTKRGKRSYSIRNQSGSLQTGEAGLGPVLVTYTAESSLEIEHNSTRTNRSRIPTVSSRIAQIKSSLRKLWRVLTQSLKRQGRRAQPDVLQEITSIKSPNEMSLELSEDAIKRVRTAVEVTSTPRITHHPPVIYPTEINLSFSSFSSWDSLSSIGSESDEGDVSLSGSFSSGSITLSLFSETDDSTSDFAPCQLSFNSP